MVFRGYPCSSRKRVWTGLCDRQDRANEIERTVARNEAEIASTEQELGHFVSVDETMRLSKLVDERRAENDALMREWEELSAAIEENG